MSRRRTNRHVRFASKEYASPPEDFNGPLRRHPPVPLSDTSSLRNRPPTPHPTNILEPPLRQRLAGTADSVFGGTSPHRRPRDRFHSGTSDTRGDGAEEPIQDNYGTHRPIHDRGRRNNPVSPDVRRSERTSNNSIHTPRFPGGYVPYEATHHLHANYPHHYTPPQQHAPYSPGLDPIPPVRQPAADTPSYPVHQLIQSRVFLHELLDPDERNPPMIVWDIRLPPSTLRIRNYGVTLLLDHLKQSAFHPEQDSMVTIESDYLPFSELIHVRPLGTGVNRTRTCITILDVLQGIYNYFQAPLTSPLYNSIISGNSGAKRRIDKAFYRRCDWLDKSRLGLERGKGMKKVDLLGGSTIFRGLTRSNVDPARTWVLEVA